MSALFTPLTVKHLTLPNRVVMPPMVSGGLPELAELADSGGQVSAPLVQHYARRAQAGTALIIVEATAVDEGGRCWPTGLGAWSDDHLPGLRRLAEAIHQGGAVAAIQLLHGGQQANPHLCPQGLVGPSDLPATENRPPVRGLTAEEITAIEQRFVEAALRAVEAGFDGVELHGAHGFLLDSFLSPERNHRTDQYGEDVKNRARTLGETLGQVRAQLPPHILVWPRLSVFNHVGEGFTAEDLREVVRAVETSGAELIHLSTDGALKPCFGEARTLGQWVRGFIQLPLIVAGGLGDPHAAERLVAEGHGDLAAVGSAMLQDPDWTAHARETLTD
jgi:2,4-dienoyl-CoA reductase-like NADH-dependent reductase (Old Yellow Enzyme family)